MLCTELAKLVVHAFQSHSVELSSKAKIADAALEFEHFKFDTSQHRRKKMIDLRGQVFSGRFAYRRVLFKRLIALMLRSR